MTNITAQVSQKQNDEQFYPDHILDLLSEAEAFKIAGEHKQAIKTIQKVLCEEPECLIAYEQIADNHLILDEEKQARIAAEFALKLDKKSYIAHYVIGFICLKKSQWKEAYEHLKKADEVLPNNPEILRCLGWNLFKMGKCTKGVILLERVLTIMPEDSIALCDLGVCYFELKHFDKALDLFAKAMEVDPENDRAQEMIQVAREVVEKLSKVSN